MNNLKLVQERTPSKPIRKYTKHDSDEICFVERFDVNRPSLDKPRYVIAYSAECKNGVPHGTSTIYNEDGIRESIEQYKNGKYVSGSEQLYEDDGETLLSGLKTMQGPRGLWTQEWENGQEHGLQTMYCDLDKKTVFWTQEWINGYQSGLRRAYRKDGTLDYIQKREDGELVEGSLVWFDENGQNPRNTGLFYRRPNALDNAHYTLEYKNGKRHGIGTVFTNKTEQVVSYTEEYKDDEFVEGSRIDYS